MFKPHTASVHQTSQAFLVLMALYCVFTVGFVDDITIKWNFIGEPTGSAPAIIAVLIIPAVLFAVYRTFVFAGARSTETEQWQLSIAFFLLAVLMQFCQFVIVSAAVT